MHRQAPEAPDFGILKQLQPRRNPRERQLPALFTQPGPIPDPPAPLIEGRENGISAVRSARSVWAIRPRAPAGRIATTLVLSAGTLKAITGWVRPFSVSAPSCSVLMLPFRATLTRWLSRI